MMKKIVKYKADSLDMWNISAIARVKDSDYVIPVDEEDITNIKVLRGLLVAGTITYHCFRDCLKYESLTFAGQDTDNKSAISAYCCAPIPTIIGYYMSTGMTQPDAIALYTRNRAIDITAAADECKKWIDSAKYKEILITYMTSVEAVRFMRDTRNLVSDFRDVAIGGLINGEEHLGILDFIHDYAGYSGIGLSTYTLIAGKTLANLIIALDDILIEGII